jgi:CHASE3 domain sensor protein
MNEEQMLADHQQSWAGFVRVATIATGIVIAILALMAITLL